MYEATKRQLLTQFIYDESDSVSIDEAIEDAKKRT